MKNKIHYMRPILGNKLVNPYFGEFIPCEIPTVQMARAIDTIKSRGNGSVITGINYLQRLALAMGDY